MNNFVSLVAALGKWFDKPLDNLPENLRERMGGDIILLQLWNDLTPEQRRHTAAQWDYQHDPATADERTYYFDLFGQQDKIEREIREVGLLAASTPLERESKMRQLAELNTKLSGINEQLGGRQKPATETPSERQLRLRQWYNEEKSCRGERGAIVRTAAREGISRQTLSSIIKNSPAVTPARLLPITLLPLRSV